MLRTRYRLEFILAGLLVVISAARASLSSAQSQPHPSQWKLVWSDEFDGPSGSAPDPTKWSYDVGGNGWGNHELEYYTNRAKNAYVQDGNLVIQALKETYTGSDGVTRNYTSARLLTAGHFSQAYGRFEARIKLPYGQGLWPAFWMVGDNIGQVGWPQCGEIDIMENVGKEPSIVHGSIHGPGYTGGTGVSAAYTLPNRARFSDDFHVFAVEWEPDVVRFYVDGNLYATDIPFSLPAGAKWAFDHPFMIILNVAVGGDWPGAPDSSTVFPQPMLVDYVRVYKPASNLADWTPAAPFRAPEAQPHEPLAPPQPADEGSRGVSRTYVDLTPAELAKAVPELKHLQPAENQDLLPQILERVGATVAGFFDNFLNTASIEKISSMVDSPRGAGLWHSNNKYNYVALARPGAAKGRLDEYRADDKGHPTKPDSESGVVTMGFVAMAIHFHPDYQPDSRFRYLGREPLEKQDTYVVAFAQRPSAAREVAAVQFDGRSGVVFMQGMAWIDPETFRILRLRTDLEQPESNVGLLKETTEVSYSEVSFKQSGKSLWLPHEVTVNGQLDKYRFHNQHRYSDYRLFDVQVDERIGSRE